MVKMGHESVKCVLLKPSILKIILNISGLAHIFLPVYHHHHHHFSPFLIISGMYFNALCCFAHSQTLLNA